MGETCHRTDRRKLASRPGLASVLSGHRAGEGSLSSSRELAGSNREGKGQRAMVRDEETVAERLPVATDRPGRSPAILRGDQTQEARGKPVSADRDTARHRSGDGRAARCISQLMPLDIAYLSLSCHANIGLTLCAGLAPGAGHAAAARPAAHSAALLLRSARPVRWPACCPPSRA